MKKTKLAVTCLAFFLMTASLAAAASANTAIETGRFELKDGHVYKKSTVVDCEVNEVPSEIKGPIRYWSVFGPDASDAVKKNETGVWFFSAQGESLGFVPLESETACQGVFFSPDSGRFVLQIGSGQRPDVTLEVYGEGMGKIAELDGLFGQIAWLDPIRLVMTRVDDTRGGPHYEKRATRAFGWRTSVVMYDTAIKETIVLKESAATQNFFCRQVIEDGKAIDGWEVYVKSEDDWGNEDKEQMRDIRIEMTAKRDP